jgi:hypothetical protein
MPRLLHAQSIDELVHVIRLVALARLELLSSLDSKGNLGYSFGDLGEIDFLLAESNPTQV